MSCGVNIEELSAKKVQVYFALNLNIVVAPCINKVFDVIDARFNHEVSFYIHCSVNRHSILIRSKKMQLMQVFITADLLYMFRASIDPIIRSISNCNTASGTGHITYQGNDLLPAWP